MVSDVLVDPSVRVFSIEEANALVPQLTTLVGAQLERAARIQELPRPEN